MSLILNGKLPVLLKGYPTVSDKYNVRGATLSSDSAVGYFGDIVSFGENGFFKVVNADNTLATKDQVGGVLLATNVKLVTDFFGGSTAKAPTNPGEAFNLLLSGYVALGCDSSVKVSDIKEGVQVGLTATGKVVPVTASTAVVKELPWYFTGISYVNGDETSLTYTAEDSTSAKGELLAEVEVRHYN